MLLMVAFLFSACDHTAELSNDRTVGANPTLPEPTTSWIPTLNIAPAVGWKDGGQPMPAADLGVAPFSAGLDHPRWIYVLPNGDVLVAESAAPPQPENNTGIKGWVADMVLKKAGSAVPSANRITLLRDADGDGQAEVRTTFISSLNSPIGMALVGSDFYVANTDSVMRYPYHEGDTQITAKGEKIADLPAGPINHHWTKNLIASPDGKTLYVTIGSNSNVAENGIDKETNRAAILSIDLSGSDHQPKLFASGLRNPNGLAWQKDTGALWTVVNERDELGSDLVPDYLTHVQAGGFYGWPYSYWGQHVDDRVAPQRPDLVTKAIVPDYALGNHVAALGLTFSTGSLLPERYHDGAFIGEHGSWNREPRSGYKVVFVPFSSGQPSGPPIDILGGFVNSDGEAKGRPVGVAMAKDGALLVADDVGNVVWRVAPKTAQ
ncbi:MAG: sorbosone dehydrogenase family protein [Rhodospirillaceae bacterium]|nr:MAG: sorbosone dehydrogenase family protein [Rhodospirillaceae bacterium]